MVAGRNVVAGDVEEVGDRIMDGDEALQLSRCLEALHDPFSPSCWLMGVLRPVVEALVGSMLNARHDSRLATS